MDQDSHKSLPIFKRSRMSFHLLDERMRGSQKGIWKGSYCYGLLWKIQPAQRLLKLSIWQMVATGTREWLQRGWRGVNIIRGYGGGKMDKTCYRLGCRKFWRVNSSWETLKVCDHRR